MSDSSSINVFISYSHTDAALVEQVVDLLRIFGSGIFLDSRQIRPGKKWRIELDCALNESSLVIVFWCYHSQSSKEVEREWSSAVSKDKDVLPLLLDETPLPEVLCEYQWLDFKHLATHKHPESTAHVQSKGQNIFVLLLSLASISSFILLVFWLYTFIINTTDTEGALFTGGTNWEALNISAAAALITILGISGSLIADLSDNEEDKKSRNTEQISSEWEDTGAEIVAKELIEEIASRHGNK